MGLGLALMTEISFKDGKVQQSNFDDYQVLRISDAPRETHVHIVPHGFDVPPGGVGEPGVPPVAPALLNAVYAAKRPADTRVASRPAGGQGLGAPQKGGPGVNPAPNYPWGRIESDVRGDDLFARTLN